ncbi:MAG TPA: NUDIX domain-containing protein [Thermoplasmata archaeon]|nr:NUDIX domain-containing protein [Thermoplasmata archaeon]
MDEIGRTKLVVDVALFSEGKVVLVRYKDTKKYDGQEGWFLPDDYLRRLEHPEDGALRVAREQAGIDLKTLDLRFIESFEGNGAWHLIFHFAGTLDAGAEVEPGTNTASAEWFELGKLPERGEVAHHGWALDILAAMGRPATELPHVRTVVE